MKTMIPLALMLLVAPAPGQSDGAFTLRASERDDRLHLNLQYGDRDGRSNWGRTIERREFSDVQRSGERITFTLRRPAGVFSFDGRGSMERASGSWEFAQSAGFRQEMERLGFRDIDDRAMFVFAMDGLTVESAKQLQGLVSDALDTAQLVRMINHGAGVRYVQAMTDAGFRKMPADEYRRARDHGVTAEYAREMAQLGITRPLAELIRMRDHGVTTDYVRAMRAAGYDVPAEELVRMRDHGVTADYVRAMRDAGHKVDAGELIRARSHGVTPEFIRRLGALGYKELELADYVRMRDHGVTPDYVEALRAAGLSGASASEIVRLRDHGITAAYVRRAKELFKETPTVEQIIRLRTRGELPGR